MTPYGAAPTCPPLTNGTNQPPPPRSQFVYRERGIRLMNGFITTLCSNCCVFLYKHIHSRRLFLKRVGMFVRAAATLSEERLEYSYSKARRNYVSLHWRSNRLFRWIYLTRLYQLHRLYRTERYETMPTNCKLVRICKEAIVHCFKVLLPSLCGQI